MRARLFDSLNVRQNKTREKEKREKKRSFSSALLVRAKFTLFFLSLFLKRTWMLTLNFIFVPARTSMMAFLLLDGVVRAFFFLSFMGRYK